MEFKSKLPNFPVNLTFDYLKNSIQNQTPVTAKILEYDKLNQVFICDLNLENTKGILPLNDYSIYRIKNPYNEIGKIVYVQALHFKDEKNCTYILLSRKDFIKEQSIMAKYGKTVQAKVTSFYDDELAFCEFGPGLYGNISLANYLHIKKAVYSLADVLKEGDIFKAKIDSEYSTHFYALTTYQVDDYYEPLEIGDIVTGKILKRVEDDNEFKYSYWFMVTTRIIGILKATKPLGYGRVIKAKLHNVNENFIKFRFDSYLD